MFTQRKNRQYVSQLAFKAPGFLIHSPETAGETKIFLKGDLLIDQVRSHWDLKFYAKIFSVKTWFCNFKIQDKNTPKKVFE